jgi:hypothetical protein
MIHAKFTNDELLLGNYILSLENNTMLKVALHNQALIMQKLEIPVGINPALMASLIPKYNPPNQNKGVSDMAKLPETLSELVDIKIAEQLFEIKRIKDEIKKTGPDLGLQIN